MRSIPQEPAAEQPAGMTAATPKHDAGWYASRVSYGVLCGVALGLWALIIVRQGWSAYIARVDFIGPYMGGYLVAAGQGNQLYDPAVHHHLQLQLIAPYQPVATITFDYPAWDALLLAPLGALPFGLAFLLWTGLNLALAALTARRLVTATAPTSADRGLLLLVILGFLPLIITLWQGQLPIPVWLGLAGATLAWRAGHERQAGGWLILGLLKPQLIVVPALALAVNRRWRALGTLGTGTAVCLGLSMLVLGNWIPGYLGLLIAFVRPESDLGDRPLLVQNWRGLVNHLLGVTGGSLADGLVLALDILSITLVIAICLPRGRRDGPAWEIRFAVAILLGLLVDPHLLLHDALVALAPGFILWRAATGPGLRRRIVRAILAAGPFVAGITEFWNPPHIQLGAWYLVVLVGTVFWAWRELSAQPLPQLLKERSDGRTCL